MVVGSMEVSSCCLIFFRQVIMHVPAVSKRLLAIFSSGVPDDRKCLPLEYEMSKNELLGRRLSNRLLLEEDQDRDNYTMDTSNLKSTPSLSLWLVLKLSSLSMYI